MSKIIFHPKNSSYCACFRVWWKILFSHPYSQVINLNDSCINQYNSSCYVKKKKQNSVKLQSLNTPAHTSLPFLILIRVNIDHVVSAPRRHLEMQATFTYWICHLLNVAPTSSWHHIVIYLGDGREHRESMPSLATLPTNHCVRSTGKIFSCGSTPPQNN